MADVKEKETRLMKVTMYADEFKKFDKGKIHSNHGLRNENAKISVLPDIAPVDKDDYPIEKENYTESFDQDWNEESENSSWGEKIVIDLADIIVDILNDPEVKENLKMFVQNYWYYKIKPNFKEIIQRIRRKETQKSNFITIDVGENSKAKMALLCETNARKQEKIIVTKEEAEKMVYELRDEERKLVAMIYIVSNLSVKDEKSDNEIAIEQSYIKQLVTEESIATMEFILNNRQLLIVDNKTVQVFDKFLNEHVSEEF